jgi:hypothetical protein
MLEELAARLGIRLFAPEEREVVQDASGRVDVGRGSWREAVELGVDRVAAGEVVVAVEVAELVEVAKAPAALVECGAPPGHLGRVGGGGLGEPSQDLVADRLAGAEVGDELDDLLFDAVGGREGLVAGVLLAAGGAVVLVPDQVDVVPPPR